MKKIIFTLIIVFLFQISWSQCRNAMPEGRFNTVYHNLKQMAPSKEKAVYAKRFVKDNCISSAQLVDVCLLFQNENRRYRIALAGYNNVVDKQNYYDIYDVFTKFSIAMRLHDEVLGLNSTVFEEPEQPNPPHRHEPQPDPFVKPNYSGLRFPDCQIYRGPTSAHCRLPMADRDFNFFVKGIEFTMNESTNLSLIKNFTQKHCLSTAQIMKLCAYLQVEKNRLVYLKFAGDKVFDLGNYFETQQLLSHSFYRDDLSYYIQQHIDPILHPVEVVIEEPCFVPDNEFLTIKKAIKDQTFSSDMMKSARHYVSTRCFSMIQIGEISKVFSSDFDKLDYFKFAYDYAPEPEKYLMFNEYLSFSSSKDKLSDFIIEQERGR